MFYKLFIGSTLVLTALVALPVVSHAQEKETELVKSVNAVCNSKAILSKKAKQACENQAFPRTLKSGLSFRNSGIGAEFNTLIRNMGNIQ